jgi:hypothetical protein
MTFKLNSLMSYCNARTVHAGRLLRADTLKRRGGTVLPDESGKVTIAW